MPRAKAGAKPARRTPADAERLAAATEFLDEHGRTCRATVEMWMLRTLPVPRGVIEHVMVDAAWRVVLRDAWIVPVPGNMADRGEGGFFRGIDPQRGIGVVDRDGETQWHASESVLIPHPVLLDEVDDLRGFAVEIGVAQGISQLFREVFTRSSRPSGPSGDGESVDAFAGAQFPQLGVAIGAAKLHGFRVRAGAATCRVLERGRFIEARYELGDGDPMYEAATGALGWVDDKHEPIALADVPPVALSEGMRMASLIFAQRTTGGTDDDA